MAFERELSIVGVRAGSNVQSFFMIVKLLVIATVIVSGLFLFKSVNALVQEQPYRGNATRLSCPSRSTAATPKK